MTAGRNFVAEERIIVQFWQCGDTAWMTLAQFLDLGGSQQQLDDIAAGIKLDAPILVSEVCDSCQDSSELRDRFTEYMLDM